MNWLDLHMHSKISNDGDYEPGELMRLCHQAGLKVVALADHNSVRGVEEAVAIGQSLGMEVISGVELDCTFMGYNLHVLGYGINVPNPQINTIETSVADQDRKASSIIMERVKEQGIYFEDDEVMALSIEGVVTGEMIAEVAMADHRNQENPLMTPYYTGGNRSDNPYVNFYWDYCASGKPAHVPVEYISLEQAVKVIRASGGVPILAHPEKNIGLDEDVLMSIVETGVKGIEVYSSYHSEEAVKHYECMASKHDLLMTVGSDFHGKTKPSIYLGQMSCGEDEETMYDKLRKHKG